MSPGRKPCGNRLSAAAGHFWESRVSGLPHFRADGNLFAANGTAARQNGLTISGLHARPKAMRLGATAVVRLKSTFRHCILGMFREMYVGNIDYTTGWAGVAKGLAARLRRCSCPQLLGTDQKRRRYPAFSLAGAPARPHSGNLALWSYGNEEDDLQRTRVVHHTSSPQGCLT